MLLKICAVTRLVQLPLALKAHASHHTGWATIIMTGQFTFIVFKYPLFRLTLSKQLHTISCSWVLAVLMFVAKTGDMIVSGVVSAWYAFKNNDMTS